MEFVFGFVLGKFLDSLGKLAEELAKNDENQVRSGDRGLLPKT